MNIGTRCAGSARAGTAAVAVAAALLLAAGSCVPSLVGGVARAQAQDQGEQFPPAAEVLRGLDKVVSTIDGQAPLYTLYRRERDARLLAELPRDFARQRIFIATTIAGGAPNTGIQIGQQLAYWQRYDRRLALVEPNLAVRTTAPDIESRTTRETLFTDRVLLDVPILAMGSGGGPIIDLGALLTENADRFFGLATSGANRRLLKLVKSKAFPQNIEVAYEMPDRAGRLITIYYSIRLIPERGSYQPRLADPRIGYFTTSFRDISRQDKDTQWVRYINRWHLEKRNPGLPLSPPKEPIVFYIEATVPVHYRRWVRDGVLAWNRAFEKIGFDNAIEVYQQDAQTGAHMDKDPEDARYNFIRWSSANLGFAIGPSRVHPETGQILDADVVIDDGFLRVWFRTFSELLPEMAMTGMPPELVAWLADRPEWDPRVRLANPGERPFLLKQRQVERAQVVQQIVRAAEEGELDQRLPTIALRSGAPLAFAPTANAGPLGGGDSLDARFNRCSAMIGKSLDMAIMRLTLEALEMLDDKDPPSAPPSTPEAPKNNQADDKKEDKRPPARKEPLLDGMPEWFVGPLLKDLVAHEVGHTLGLRHNFKASSIYTLEQINSEAWKGQRPIAGSVMDYLPVNINFDPKAVQGDYAMIGVGPYDLWAIEYGYGSGDLKKVLERVSDPELAYGTDEDVGGIDPRIKQFDLGQNPLDYADQTMRLVQSLRARIIEKIVKDGDSWQRARDAYNLLLARHVGAVRTASHFLGGADLVRDRKGDPGNRPPLTPTDVAQQRRALRFLVENVFRDEAFGLTRELLARMTIDRWWDAGDRFSIFEDPAWPIHDRILGVQASALTMVLNPIALQRIYDGELRVDPGADALTLPELIDTLSGEIFSELSQLRRGTARDPSISSLRRNLQKEYLDRLIDLTLPGAGFTAAYKPISNLIVLELRRLKDLLDAGARTNGIDPYTRAHLTEAALRVGKALEAQFIYNAGAMNPVPAFGFFFGQPVQGVPPVAPQRGPARPGDSALPGPAVDTPAP
jgi:hypothetical protein